MKARIKETGEFVEIDMVELEEELFNADYLHTEYKTTKSIFEHYDLEQRRWELVKAAMQGLLSTHSPGLFDKKLLAVLSFDYADTVLAEYRKGGEE